MTSLVFDTGALALLYASDERVRTFVEGIDRGRDQGFISSVTLSEFYYKTCQSLGRDVANIWCRQLDARLRVVEPDVELALAAGAEKCKNGRLSLADSHALALTNAVRGTLLTTDSELARAGAKARFFRV